MNKLIIILLFFNFFVISCSKKEVLLNDEKIIETPEKLYISANQTLNAEKYLEAVVQFEELIRKFPLSNEGIQSHIMIGFIDYLKLDYIGAINRFDKVINLYPSHKNIDYAYYMKAMCYFEQIEHESLDGINSRESNKIFKEIINRFPKSQYTRDSKQKLIFINENIAAKHMSIGKFYLNQNKYLASLNRFNNVINDHKKSKFVPEALFRTIEIYYTLGLDNDAEKTAGVLGYNYPKSQWYEDAYKLVLKQNKNNIKKNLLLEKLSNFFNNEKK